MKVSETRDMFVKWMKATMWSANGLDMSKNYLGEFDQPYENMYQAYAAGVRKGMRIQKEKSNARS